MIFIDKAPVLLRKMLANFPPDFPLEMVDDISADAWEGRILPLLYELELAGKFRRRMVQFEGAALQLLADVNALDAFVPFLSMSASSDAALSAANASSDAAQAAINVYIFDACTDLSVLRRFKEYPDETERAALESFWVGYSQENAAFLFVNPGKFGKFS